MDFEKEKKFCISVIGSEYPSYRTLPKVIRNMALLAAMRKDKVSWDKIIKFQHHFFVEMNDEEGVPEMKFFRRMAFFMPPRNRFVQLLHNVISYQGLSSWLNQFLTDEASSVDGTYYMAAGVGPVEAIQINMKKWNWKLHPSDLLKWAHKGKSDPKVCSFLISQGAE